MSESSPIARLNLRELAIRLLGGVVPPKAGDSERTLGGPGTPVSPTEPAGTDPRGLVLPMYYNTSAQPRTGGGISLTPFASLRSLAGFDLIRVAIADAKNQILGMEWTVRAAPAFKGQEAKLGKTLEMVREFIEMPDPLAQISWLDWLGSVAEEIMVTDALTLLPRRNLRGDLIALEQIDGATILPLVDDRGRPPLPPLPAFQQFVRGMPETDFKLGEIMYLPRNRRNDSPYGRGNVENILVTANISIRQMLFDLGYYTTGNVPDGGFWSLTEATADQLIDLQEKLDTLSAGQTDRRAGYLKLMPPGTYVATKTRQWSYDELEWLGRIVSWAFGVSPIPIAKQMNRATGEVLEQSALEAGPRPIAGFIAKVLNRALRVYGGVVEVEFAWADDEVEDPKTVAERTASYVSRGIMTRNEAREVAGLEPYDYETPAMIETPTGVLFVEDLIAASERAKEQDQSTTGFDPNKLQRALLEVPLLTVDELRVALGLKPLGGTAGDQFAQISPAAPVAPDPATPGTGPEDGPPKTPPAGSSDPSSSSPPEDPPTAQEKAWSTAFAKYRAAVAEDLRKWARVRKHADSRGRAPRAFVSSVMPPRVRKLLELAAPSVAADVVPLFKGEATPTRARRKVEKEIVAIFSEWLDELEPKVLAYALERLPADKLGKAGPPDFDAGSLADRLEKALEDGGMVGVVEAGAAIGVNLDTVPEYVVTYARTRAGELIGRKYVAGEWVDSTTGSAISDTIRRQTEEAIARAIEEKWTPAELKSTLSSFFEISRAETIARTETGFAYGNGAAELYQSEGIALVSVVDGPGCLPFGHDDGAPKSDGELGVVEADAQAENQIWTVAQYQSAILGHPNCVRTAVPYIAS